VDRSSLFSTNRQINQDIYPFNTEHVRFLQENTDFTSIGALLYSSHHRFNGWLVGWLVGWCIPVAPTWNIGHP
jgi:hypothetical protein